MSKLLQRSLTPIFIYGNQSFSFLVMANDFDGQIDYLEQFGSSTVSPECGN